MNTGRRTRETHRTLCPHQAQSRNSEAVGPDSQLETCDGVRMQTKLLWTSGLGVRGQVHSEERTGGQGAEAEHAVGGRGAGGRAKAAAGTDCIFSLPPTPF